MKNQNRQGVSRRSLVFLFTILTIGCATRSSAATITVPDRSDLQAVLNGAACGDTIKLEAGGSWEGPFTLPNKGCTSYITITTTGTVPAVPDFIGLCYQQGPTLLAEQARKATCKAAMKSQYASAKLPKLYTRSTGTAVGTALGADYWRFIGVEIYSANTSTDAPTYTIMRFGFDGPDGTDAKSAADIPDHIFLDRVYLHGNPLGSTRRAILANASNFTLINSFCDDIHEIAQDNQCLMAYNGPGPFRIENNFLEAAGENIMFGGAPPSISGMVPSDIVQTRNYMSKDPTWWADAARIGFAFGGKAWLVKNVTECKNCQRNAIHANVMEFSWQMNQNGPLVLMQSLNDGGGCPWCVVKDVSIYNNVIRHGGQAVQLGGKVAGQAKMGSNIQIYNNLMYDVSTTYAPGAATCFMISSGSSSGPTHEPFDRLLINHNTCDNSVDGGVFAVFNGVGDFFSNLTITNNFGRAPGTEGKPGEWYDAAIVFSGASGGRAGFDTYAPNSYSVSKNVIGTWAAQTVWPGSNDFVTPTQWDAIFVSRGTRNYNVAAGNRYKNAATDGTDVGVNWVIFNAAFGAGTGSTPAAPIAPNNVRIIR